MTPVEDGVVRVTRTVMAAPEAVWAAFTEPEAMAAWMWAGIGERPRAVAEVKPGGRYRVAIDEAPGTNGWESSERAFQGLYVVVDPPRRLVYTLRWEAPVGYNQSGEPVLDEVVVVDIEAAADGTSLVQMAHLGIPEVGAAAHEQGIEAMFDALQSLLGSVS